MSFTIARRRREIGIRTALDAGPRRVLGSVLRKAAAQIAVGVALGIAVAGLLVQTLEGGRADPRGLVVLVLIAAILALVGFIATLGRRAARYAFSRPKR